MSIMTLTKRQLWIGTSALAAAAVIGLGIAGWIVYEPDIPPNARPLPSRFSPELISRGEQLATVGDCIVCHTTEGGRPFAGARALPTPFGTLYSTNITPDEKTGIGTWSQAAFDRAMTRGVARDGSQLYPALPYEHFTHVKAEDLAAIYAFLMTREAVSQAPPPNKLIPGLGFRPLLAGWKLLFLHEGAFEPDTTRSVEWNRGKYLVDGLAHCGACHTPRNLLGGEELGREFGGGVAEGWNAPPLDATNPMKDSWDAASLYSYLKTGMATGHSAAAGPMGPVTEGLSRLNDADVKAISTYIASRMNPDGAPTKPAQPIDHAVQAQAAFPKAADLFQGACSGCHGDGAPMRQAGRPSLATASDLHADDPRNAIQTVLQGIAPPVQGAGPFMPAFANNLTDKQLADLLSYARARFTDAKSWPDLQSKIASIRKENAQ